MGWLAFALSFRFRDEAVPVHPFEEFSAPVLLRISPPQLLAAFTENPQILLLLLLQSVCCTETQRLLLLLWIAFSFTLAAVMSANFSQTGDSSSPPPRNNNQDDAPPPLNAGQLSWRMPPDESHSDWTVEISTTESATSKPKTLTFHVHKNILSVGPKMSSYFQRLFLNTNFAESETKTSTIELETPAADAFACMLDYLYSPEHKLDITTDNAVALHFLGQYFECHRLRWEASHFCKNDLSINNCGTYYEHAKIFHDDEISKLVAEKSYDKLDQIALDSHLIKVSDVALWRSVIQLIIDGHRRLALSKYLSRLIAEFCSTHEDLLDGETFTRLTDATHMLAIDKDAAVPLLQLEGFFVPESKDGGVLSSLQTRCVGAIASCWESIDVSSLQEDLSGLNPNLLAFAFSDTLANAKIQLKKAQFAEGKDPPRIIVRDAGIPGVNGVYAQEGFFENRPQYVCNGVWREHRYKFHIFLCNVSNNTKHWYISIVPYGGNPGTSSDIDFYTVPLSENGGNSPPKSGWFKAVEGMDPPPTLSYDYDYE